MIEQTLASTAAVLPLPGGDAPASSSRSEQPSMAQLRDLMQAAVALWPALDDAGSLPPRPFYAPLMAHLAPIERLIAAGYVLERT